MYLNRINTSIRLFCPHLCYRLILSHLEILASSALHLILYVEIENTLRNLLIAVTEYCVPCDWEAVHTTSSFNSNCFITFTVVYFTLTDSIHTKVSTTPVYTTVMTNNARLRQGEL